MKKTAGIGAALFVLLTTGAIMGISELNKEDKDETALDCYVSMKNERLFELSGIHHGEDLYVAFDSTHGPVNLYAELRYAGPGDSSWTIVDSGELRVGMDALSGVVPDGATVAVWGQALDYCKGGVTFRVGNGQFMPEAHEISNSKS